MLREPALGGAGLADEEERAIGDQRGDGDLDEAARTDVLGRDLDALFADTSRNPDVRRELIY